MSRLESLAFLYLLGQSRRALPLLVLLRALHALARARARARALQQEQQQQPGVL
jgi:hypothetical protein